MHGGERSEGGEVMVDEVVESEEVIEAAEEDTDPIRVLPTPYTPTQQEVDEHNIDHIPPRSWCPHCANGFAREDPHSCKPAGRSIPVVSMDYLFLTRKGIF